MLNSSLWVTCVHASNICKAFILHFKVYIRKGSRVLTRQIILPKNLVGLWIKNLILNKFCKHFQTLNPHWIVRLLRTSLRLTCNDKNTTWRKFCTIGCNIMLFKCEQSCVRYNECCVRHVKRVSKQFRHAWINTTGKYLCSGLGRRRL